MWFLPYDRLTIGTDLSPEEVRRRLEEVIGPRQWFQWLYSRDDKPYQGEWDGKRFKISPVSIRRRSRYLPVIQGEIFPQYPGTIIELVMRQDIIYVIVMILYCILVVGGPGAGTSVTCSFVTAFWLLVPYLMTMIGFKTQSAKSRKFFQELLEERSSDDWNI